MENNTQSVIYELENGTYNVTRIFCGNADIRDIIRAVTLREFQKTSNENIYKKTFINHEDCAIIKMRE